MVACSIGKTSRALGLCLDLDPWLCWRGHDPGQPHKWQLLAILRSGTWEIVSSLILFLIFASFLGGPNLLGVYWPVLLIALGVLVLLRGLARGRQVNRG